MRLEVAAILRLDKGGFLRSHPKCLDSIEYTIDVSEQLLRDNFGLRALPSHQTAIIISNISERDLQDFIDWGKVRVEGVHRAMRIQVREKHSEEDLLRSEYVFFMAAPEEVSVLNEGEAFRVNRCTLCGRSEWRQVGQIALTGKLSRRHIAFTDASDFIAKENVAKIFIKHGVQVSDVINNPTHWQIDPAEIFRFAGGLKHQKFFPLEPCRQCNQHIGCMLTGHLEGRGPINDTTDLLLTRNFPPIRACVREGAIGRSHMFAAYQSYMGLLRWPENGIIDSPYTRSDMQTMYILSGQLARTLRDEIGWKALSEFIRIPAILEGRS